MKKIKFTIALIALLVISIPLIPVIVFSNKKTTNKLISVLIWLRFDKLVKYIHKYNQNN